MSSGRVIESGTHAQLLAAGGVYREMWDLQLKERENPVQGCNRV
jgi:ABC-type multidrug transport system fused ATPase/permease subunit